MDAETPPHDPVTQFVLDQIDFFAEQSVQLGDEHPLRRFQEITDAFYEIVGCLGTLRHAVALDHLKRGFKRLRGEALTGLRHTWNEFWTSRRKAKELRHDEEAQQVKARGQLEKLEAMLLDAKAKASPVAEPMERAVAAFRKIADREPILSEAWERTSWVLLRVSSRLLSLYFGYLLHRLRVLLIFHSYTFLVPIAIVGIGYSFASRYFIEHLTALVAQAPWVTAGLILAVYAFKRYYLDDKLKKLQVRVETALFTKLSVRLLMAQTLSLRWQTALATARNAYPFVPPDVRQPASPPGARR